MKRRFSPDGSGRDDLPPRRPAAPSAEATTDADPLGNAPKEPSRAAGEMPDLAVCRARRKKKGGFVYCLVLKAFACQYVTCVENNLICCHPDKEEIILRTELENGQ